MVAAASDAPSAHDQKRHVHLVVSASEAAIQDGNGPKVPETIAASLFEPHVSTKGAGQGTGLGLWISRQLTNKATAPSSSKPRLPPALDL